MARKLRPTALVCGNDWCTGVVVDELDHLGFSIPGDVELASVDDNDVYESLDVPVLHAKQAGQRMGEEAARRLVERVAGAGLETRHLTLKATLYDMPEAVRIAKLPC